MTKPPASILSRNEGQCLGNGLLQGFPRASADPSQKGFQLGERFLNGREIGGVRRQKEQATASGFDGLLDTRPLVNTQIIQNHDLSRMQAGSQNLLHVACKRGSISGAIQDEGFSYPLGRQRSDQGHVRPVVAGDFAHCTLSSGGISIQRRHRDVGAGLIHKDQILASQMQGLLAPFCSRRFILLAGSQGLFFRVQPRAILAREMLAGLTLIPVFSSHMRQCSSRLTSGWRSNCSSRPARNAAPFFAGRPGIAFGKTSPVSRRALRYRLMVGTETAKVSATSAWLAPASMARSTRCRRSCEYAFMPIV